MASNTGTNNANERRRSVSALGRILTKIVVSVVFGFGAFGLAQLLDGPTEGQTLLAIGASVFVSGVAFLVQFLAEVESRIDRVEHRIDQLNAATIEIGDRYEAHGEIVDKMIRDQFQKINAATQLFGAVEESALRIDETTQLVRDATLVMHNGPPLVSRFAHGEITRLARYLKALGHGIEVSYPGEDRDWLLGLTAAATTSIQAISLATVDAGGHGFTEGGLWNSDLGQRYLAAQQEAASRDVSVRRVFVFDEPGFSDDRDFMNVLRQHVNAGVEVRTLEPGGPGTDRASFTDFIVIDEVISYQSLPASTPKGSAPIIARTTLVTDLDWVRRRTHEFNELWKAAKPYTLPAPIPPQRVHQSRSGEA
jgi:hypothetical protein